MILWHIGSKNSHVPKSHEIQMTPCTALSLDRLQVMVVQHQLSRRQSWLRIDCNLVQKVGQLRRLKFLHDETEEIRFVGGMICGGKVCKCVTVVSSYAGIGSAERSFQRVRAMTLDWSRWASKQGRVLCIGKALGSTVAMVSSSR